MKVLYLSKFHTNDNLFENLKSIKHLGTHFNIKYKNMLVKSSILYDSNRITNKKFYTIYSLTDDTFAYKIRFFENCKAHVEYIHKTDQYSGSQIVQFVIKLCKVLKVKEVTLYDATRIKCGEKEYDLSFLKLLEHGKTFYMKFGFKFIDYDKKTVTGLLKKCRKLKTNALIIFYKRVLKMLIKSKNCNKFVNINKVIRKKLILKKSKCNIDSEIKYICKILDVLTCTKKKYFYKLMIYVFKNKCELYEIIEDMINDTTYKIKNIKFDLLDNFKLLRVIRNTTNILLI